MPVANGKKFKFESEKNICPNYLEIFSFKDKKELITIETSEFSAVCPFSGLPDIATVVIKYIPNGKCIELKSLKYYFMSFRNVGIYQEAVTSKIYSDLKNILKTKNLYVKTEYNTRGGMNVVAECGVCK